MKTNILIVLSCLLVLTNCSVDNSNENDTSQTVKFLWNLRSVNHYHFVNNFDLGKIVWTFNNNYTKLTITNSTESGDTEIGLDSGVYDVSIMSVGQNSFLFINGVEFGYIYYPSETKLVIDQNITTTEEYLYNNIYTFERTLVKE